MALPLPLRSVLAGVVAALALTVPTGSPATAAGAACRQAVLLHDIAGTPASVEPLAERIRARGWCTTSLAWGPAPLLSGLGPGFAGVGGVGGLASVEDAAPEVARRLAVLAAGAPGGRVDVVAVGAGSLVALRAVQVARAPVRRLVSVGSLWDGTNLLGLGDLEQLSRDAGTYDLVLGVEKVLMDGACASCRELIRGSDLLRRMRADGLRPRGLRQVDVLTRTDGLVVPWSSGRRRGVPTLVVQRHDPASRVAHFGLPRDPVVQRLVVTALTRTS